MASSCASAVGRYLILYAMLGEHRGNLGVARQFAPTRGGKLGLKLGALLGRQPGRWLREHPHAFQDLDSDQVLVLGAHLAHGVERLLHGPGEAAHGLHSWIMSQGNYSL